VAIICIHLIQKYTIDKRIKIYSNLTLPESSNMKNLIGIVLKPRINVFCNPCGQLIDVRYSLAPSSLGSMVNMLLFKKLLMISPE